jgi:hypothetical protein
MCSNKRSERAMLSQPSARGLSRAGTPTWPPVRWRTPFCSLWGSREIIFTVVRSDLVDTVLGEIVRAADMNDTGRAIALVVPVEKVAPFAS